MDNRSKHRRAQVFAFLACALLVVAAPASAGRGKSEKSNEGPQLVSGVTMNGPLAAITLADGRVVEIPASLVKISQDAVAEPGSASDGKAGAQAGVKQRKRIALDEVVARSQASGELPAILNVKYDRDGHVKRARLMLFASKSEASAFLDRAARHRAEMKSAKPNN